MTLKSRSKEVMKHIGLLRYCVVVLLMAPVVSAQIRPESVDETKVQACMTKYFGPAQSPMWSEETKRVEIVRCTKPSSRICDIAYGIRQKKSDGVHCLIDGGFDFSIDGGNLIAQAAYWDDGILRLLFESDAVRNNIEIKDSMGYSPLLRLTHLYSRSIDRARDFSWDRIYRSAEFLLEKGANPNSFGDKMTPLMFQAGAGTSKFVELLLRYKADPNLQSPSGATALMMALDEPRIIKLLLDANADIYIKDNNGKSSIFYAVENCQLNKMQALLARDPRILESTDSSGKTALSYLKSSQASSECRNLRKLVRDR